MTGRQRSGITDANLQSRAEAEADLKRQSEDEEIVAQVSSLISNLDLNQQCKLMS